MHILAGLFVLYFCLLALGMFWRSQTVRGPWFYLLRAFFPNWQFYHLVGPVPHLYVRSQAQDAPWSEWRLVYPRQQRHVVLGDIAAGTKLYQPAALACQSPPSQFFSGMP